MNLITFFTLLGLLVCYVNGLKAPQRQVLITYPNEAPQAELDDYKHAIEAAGGVVLHEFQLMKY